MTGRDKAAPTPPDILLGADSKRRSVPVWVAGEGHGGTALAALTREQHAWLEATGYKPSARRHALLPGQDGGLAGVVLGAGRELAPDPSDRPQVALGLLPAMLPAGAYHLGNELQHAELGAVAWGLGAYRFRRYRTGNNGGDEPRALKLPKGVDRDAVTAIVEAVWLGRDLINTPANDMGPAELEQAARALAKRHGAKVSSIVGDDLLAKNFPMIHAVGRASPRAPRLVDIGWSPAGAPTNAPRVTLIGKGICFDTGGLDIKPSSGMLLMKKDMGGAAAVLALGHMIMQRRLPVRLRILLAIAENSIAGNAFRPGDVIPTRSGKTVEIGNTDAEGRLVLCDALTLADEEKPDTLLTFATLTGAARVAVGPELAPFYCDDDAFAARLAAAGDRVADPLWRMPFWAGYESFLDSAVADMNNVSDGPFAGSVTAALYLRRFVREAKRYAHLDIYGWRPTAKPLGPKGGEVNAARAAFAALAGLYPS